MSAVAASTNHSKTAKLNDLITTGFVRPTKANIRSTAGHLSGHGYFSNIARFRDDPRFLGIILRIEDDNINTLIPQAFCQRLGFRDVMSSNQHWLTGCVNPRDLLNNRGGLVFDGCVNTVGFIEAAQRGAALNHRYAEIIKLPKLVNCLHSRASHPTHHGIAPHQRLQRDGVEDPATFSNIEAFLRLHRGMHPIGPALQICNPPAGSVDDLYLAIANDVMHIPVQQMLGVQSQVDLNQGGAHVLLVIQAGDAQLALHNGSTCVVQKHRASVLGDFEMLRFR